MKYDVGDFMMLHRDSIKYNRILIVSFVITDDYTGGELVLYDPTYVVEKNFGAVYCFDPFRFHEVKPIINGTRYSVMASYLVDNVKIKEKPERAF